jgi:hypothetical protein
MMRYELIAWNKQGASVVFEGNTKREALAAFDAAYERSGFEIKIYDTEGRSETTVIKSTFR